MAIISITSGMVSRVSPPAQSTGLLRLHRGGSLVSINDLRSSGSCINCSDPSCAIASLVTTPHPPAVVRMTTFGPFGSGWVANVAAASNASSTVAARVMPPALQAPSKIASFAASAPVWLAAARAPFSVAPPLTTTTGFVRAAVVRRDMRPAPSLMPST